MPIWSAMDLTSAHGATVMRRILLIWAIKNKRWGIVILLLLINEGKEDECELDKAMEKESGWQEYLSGLMV